MPWIGHILEHAPNNVGQLLHGNRQAGPGEYYNETAQNYLQTNSDTSSDSRLWADSTPGHQGSAAWRAHLTKGDSDGWGCSRDSTATPVFQQEDGESSTQTRSMTSSDSGNYVIDMSDMNPMSDAHASEHVFWQYRTHRRQWRRLTGQLVLSIQRHDGYLCEAPCRNKRPRARIRLRHRIRGRAYAVTQDAIRAYLGLPGQGMVVVLEKGHARKQHPRGRDGHVTTCRIGNSE